MERTLAIIKPDGIAQGYMGKVLSRIEEAGFRIIAMKMIRMNPMQAGAFYAMHKGKSFYSELISFMTEGRCVVAVLEKNNAVADWRQLMGATDPKLAAEGTIRKELAQNVSRNVVHGSDSIENAQREISFFFSESELLQNELNS